MATAAIVSVSVAYAFAAYFARHLTDAGLSPVSVAFARFALIAALLAPVVRFDRTTRAATAWAMGSGAAMAFGWIAFVHAVDTGDVAMAGVVYLTYPLFTVVALALVFGVRPAPLQIAGGALVVVGAVVARGPGLGAGVSPIAVLAPATFGFAIATLTQRLGPLDPLQRIAATSIGASIGLLPILVTLPLDRIIPPTGAGWVQLVGLGIGCGLVPMTVYAAAAPSIGGARSAVAGSAELPTMFAIGWIFFGETISPKHVVAAVIIMAAVAITPAGTTSHEGRPSWARRLQLTSGACRLDRSGAELRPPTTLVAAEPRRPLPGGVPNAARPRR